MRLRTGAAASFLESGGDIQCAIPAPSLSKRKRLRGPGGRMTEQVVPEKTVAPEVTQEERVCGSPRAAIYFLQEPLIATACSIPTRSARALPAARSTRSRLNCKPASQANLPSRSDQLNAGLARSNSQSKLRGNRAQRYPVGAFSPDAAGRASVSRAQLRFRNGALSEYTGQARTHQESALPSLGWISP